MAKLAHGIADNLLTVTALAASCPVLLAPAMDGGMFAHPSTQENLETLMDRDVLIIGPTEGHLASGMTGLGRMVEPDELFGHIRFMISRQGPLMKHKVVVSAGGTQEPIDPVRVIANRSSGKQGYAIAQAALDRGADVVLITAANHLTPPTGAEVVSVRTAEQMKHAVLKAIPGSAALIMTAAVADFRPISPSSRKLIKEKGIPDITLEATADILAAVADGKSSLGYPRITVGFAAESEDMIENAREKLEAKKLDLIVANDITAADAGFEFDTNRVTILDAGGGKETLPLMTKDEVAQSVLERLMGLLGLQ
jgi:phosphopantothenoylcysteine decarboxylase/phosphopantothenate--cysteine ligase